MQGLPVSVYQRVIVKGLVCLPETQIVMIQASECRHRPFSPLSSATGYAEDEKWDFCMNLSFFLKVFLSSRNMVS